MKTSSTLGGMGLADNLAADGQYFVQSPPTLSHIQDTTNHLIYHLGHIRRRPPPPAPSPPKRTSEVQDLRVRELEEILAICEEPRDEASGHCAEYAIFAISAEWDGGGVSEGAVCGRLGQ